jgi:hypothetical protein
MLRCLTHYVSYYELKTARAGAAQRAMYCIFLALVYQRLGLNHFNYIMCFPGLRPLPGPFPVRS